LQKTENFNGCNDEVTKRVIDRMGIKFSFVAYGILAIAALALVLSFSSTQVGQSDWAGNFFSLATFIVVLFIVYMFVKMLRR